MYGVTALVADVSANKFDFLGSAKDARSPSGMNSSSAGCGGVYPSTAGIIEFSTMIAIQRVKTQLPLGILMVEDVASVRLSLRCAGSEYLGSFMEDWISSTSTTISRYRPSICSRLYPTRHCLPDQESSCITRGYGALSRKGRAKPTLATTSRAP